MCLGIMFIALLAAINQVESGEQTNRVACMAAGSAWNAGRRALTNSAAGVSPGIDPGMVSSAGVMLSASSSVDAVVANSANPRISEVVIKTAPLSFGAVSFPEEARGTGTVISAAGSMRIRGYADIGGNGAVVLDDRSILAVGDRWRVKFGNREFAFLVTSIVKGKVHLAFQEDDKVEWMGVGAGVSKATQGEK